jgi:hypothetical protein
MIGMAEGKFLAADLGKAVHFTGMSVSRIWEMNADQFADQGIVIFTLSALVPSILQTN